ncbi:MAG TPA: DUF3795 domain-containing protein [Bacteroidales bacterium]|nr:DUF3795 domain-containing protein [Bacteroidales bacterium]
MKNEIRRREFVSGCFKAGAACIVLTGGGNLFAGTAGHQDKPDPKKLEYCGYKCPDDCPLKKGTLENNTELKKKAYTEFRIKEKHNIDFDADRIFCYGCKAGNHPLGPVVKDCPVRQCAISKGFDSCIQCDGLSKCDKPLWKEFPKFFDYVTGLQKKYRA